MQNLDYNSFIYKLLKKRDLLNSVLEIANNQDELIIKDNVKMLVRTINMRKKYLDEVQRLDKKFSLNKDVSQLYDDSFEGYTLQNEITVIINDILKMDLINCSKAKEKLQEYKKEFKDLKHDNKRLISYKSPGTQSDSIYIDTKK